MITKQGAVSTWRTHTKKMDSEYLENYVWICGHANYLDQGRTVQKMNFPIKYFFSKCGHIYWRNP